jgi:hypothetical protein
MSGFLARLLLRAGIAEAAGEEISFLSYRGPSRFEPTGTEDAVLVETVEKISAAAPSAAPVVHEPLAGSDSVPATAPPRQRVIRESPPSNGPRASGAPVQASGTSAAPAGGPSRSAETPAPRARPAAIQDQPRRFADRLPQAPPPPASIAAPPAPAPPAQRNSGELALPRAPPERARPAPPERQLAAKAAPASAPEPRIRRAETLLPGPSVPSLQRTEPPPETIIEIARVEIVASQPEPRRIAAAAPRKPTTSLADYLSRRRR